MAHKEEGMTNVTEDRRKERAGLVPPSGLYEL
jgi:hypothetical protein